MHEIWSLSSTISPTNLSLLIRQCVLELFIRIYPTIYHVLFASRLKTPVDLNSNGRWKFRSIFLWTRRFIEYHITVDPDLSSNPNHDYRIIDDSWKNAMDVPTRYEQFVLTNTDIKGLVELQKLIRSIQSRYRLHLRLTKYTKFAFPSPTRR